MNANGGCYQNGTKYSTQKKVEVELVYWRLKVDSGGKIPSQRLLAQEARVGKTYASKIIAEVERSGGIVPIEKLKEERWETKEKSVGCLCISLQEQVFLLQLRTE